MKKASSSKNKGGFTLNLKKFEITVVAALVLLLGTATMTSALSSSSASSTSPEAKAIRTEIATLLEKVEALKQQLKVIQQDGTSTSTPRGDKPKRICPLIARALLSGSQGDDVKDLQEFLAEEGYFDRGNISAYFGPLTQSALKKWQAAQGIISSGDTTTTGWGAVGPRTKEFILKRCGGLKEDRPMPPFGISTSPQADTTDTTLPEKEDGKEKAPRCKIWTTPQAVSEKVSYTVGWNITGGKGTIIYPSGESINVGTKDGSIKEKGRSAGTYKYSLKVENGARSVSCSTSIKVTVATPTPPTPTPPSPTVEYETYRAYVDGDLVEEELDTVREDAYDACLEVAEKYSDDAIRCTWGSEEIYTREAPTTERSLDLKVNGSNGPIELRDEEQIAVTWKSSGFTKCGIYAVWPAIGDQYANVPDLGLSGSRTMYAYAPYYPVTIRLRCQTTAPSGSPIIEDDTVQVIKPSDE